MGRVVWEVEFVCLLVGDFTLVVFFFICTGSSWLGLKFNWVPVLQLFLKFKPIIRFQLDQFLYNSSISVILIDCICPLVQQRCSFFCPCRYQLFSLLQGKTHSSYVSPQVYLFLFCRLCKILCKQGDFVGTLHISFPSSNLPPYGPRPGPFHCIWHMWVVLYRLPCGVHTFGIWSISGELGLTVQPSLHNSQSSPPWECGVG